MSGLSGVIIRPYANIDYAAISSYRLPDEQAIYTSMPVDVVEAFQKDSANQPFVIYVDQALVGCFALYTEPKGNVYTANEKALLLKSFSIDSRYQKRGYALRTLQILPELAKRLYSQKDEIILTVHYTNTPAQNLYRKAGFVDKGLRYEGEYGEEWIMHMDVKLKE